MDISHVSDLLLVATVSFLGSATPGPDFLLVVRNSLMYSRKAGIFTSIGISLALLIHLIYTFFGLSLLSRESDKLLHALKYLGAFYLIYLGFSSFKTVCSIKTKYFKSQTQITSYQALEQGFLTNLFNPTAIFFYISLFSQFITAETSILERVEYGFINWAIALGWFTLLSILITATFFSRLIDRFRGFIAKSIGFILIFLGIRMFA